MAPIELPKNSRAAMEKMFNPDGEETFEVKPVGKRMRCPACKLGFMELDPTGTVLMSNPPQIPHKCNKCGEKAHFFRQYPFIDFEMVTPDTYVGVDTGVGSVGTSTNMYQGSETEEEGKDDSGNVHGEDC